MHIGPQSVALELVAGGALAAGAVAALTGMNEASAEAETKTSVDGDATLAVENNGSGYAIIARQTAISPTTPGTKTIVVAAVRVS